MDLAWIVAGLVLSMALAFESPTHLLIARAGDIWPETSRHGQ
jgi:hypothetical protein